MGKALLRVSHQFASGEDPQLSQPATVDLASLLPGLEILEVTELTLTASMPKSKVGGGQTDRRTHSVGGGSAAFM
jgi:hypothetical protein